MNTILRSPTHTNTYGSALSAIDPSMKGDADLECSAMTKDAATSLSTRATLAPRPRSALSDKPERPLSTFESRV